MNPKTFLTNLAVGAALMVSARADLFDNFDSYSSKAQFDAAWTPSTGTGLDLHTSEFLSGPNSVRNLGTAAQSSRRFMQPIAGNSIRISYDFYDADAAVARDYLVVQSRVGTDFSGGLNNLLAIGKYNNITGNKYYGRVSTATGAVYGDGASAANATWFQLGGATDRSVGWHSAEIIGASSVAYADKVQYSFYIDGVLGGTVDNCALFDYNWVVLGSGLSTVGSPIAMDNLRVTLIPEPSSIALVFLGGLSLLLRKRVG